MDSGEISAVPSPPIRIQQALEAVYHAAKRAMGEAQEDAPGGFLIPANEANELNAAIDAAELFME